jgi:hypothetical protein
VFAQDFFGLKYRVDGEFSGVAYAHASANPKETLLWEDKIDTAQFHAGSNVQRLCKVRIDDGRIERQFRFNQDTIEINAVRIRSRASRSKKISPGITPNNRYSPRSFVVVVPPNSRPRRPSDL